MADAKKAAVDATPAAAPTTMTVAEHIERWFGDTVRGLQGLSGQHYAQLHHAKEDLKKILQEVV